MSINISMLNATGKLDKYIPLIEDKIKYSLAVIRDFFKLDCIDITVTPFHKGDESPSGIGGYTLSPYRVELLLDCDRGDLDRIIEKFTIYSHKRSAGDISGLAVEESVLETGEVTLF